MNACHFKNKGCITRNYVPLKQKRKGIDRESNRKVIMKLHEMRYLYDVLASGLARNMQKVASSCEMKIFTVPLTILKSMWLPNGN